ncbi:MAG: ammonium transporter [Terriglobales bacterium]
MVTASTPIPDSSVAICIAFIVLVPLASAGLALMNTGLGRSRSAAHSMLASLCVMAVAAAAYFVCGFAVQGYSGRPAHLVIIAGKGWNWIASERLFFRGLEPDVSPASLAALLQMLSVGFAAGIPLGGGAERWRLGACCLSTAWFAGWTYPLFAHWVWGGGWLAQLGSNYGLGRGFLDAAGGSTIQVTGGLTALAMAWILGPRQGRYGSGHLHTAFPGHNIVFVLFGCVLALVGWMGLNGAGALLFSGTGTTRLVAVIVITILSPSASLITAVGITRLRFGKPDASLSGNAWMGGLVASSAACAFITPWQAILLGAVAGALVTSSIIGLDRVQVDDPGGAVSVHAVAGLWGVVAVGIFVRGSGQLLAQLAGAATLLGFVLPLTYVLNVGLNRLVPQRLDPRGERDGIDVFELGAGAYPEASEF